MAPGVVNLYPMQLMGDVSYVLGKPQWIFGEQSTRVGVRGTWRSLDEHSPRFDTTAGDAEPGQDKGNEGEIRTYVHASL